MRSSTRCLERAVDPDLRFFEPRAHPFVPLEFSLAAYRVGHSMVRPSYALSSAQRERGGLLAIFGGIAEDSLFGGRVLPPGWTVQWDFFVEQAQSRHNLQFSKTIGPQISRPLRMLPMPAAEEPRLRSLAFRTLLRGWRMALPSGQDVARRMAEPVLDGNDPLWIYVLKEAAQPAGGEKRAAGHRLGPVGARIVAEVFIGLLAADPNSYFAVNPSWTPEGDRDFELPEFLAEAGAPISGEDWEKRPGS